MRNLMFEGDTQSATLRGYTAQLQINQTLFNGFKTGNQVRQAEASVRSGRETLRGVEQSVLLDAVTAYGNVLANQALVEAQRANVAFLRETITATRQRLQAGDVTPTDLAQTESRLSRGLADLNSAEVNLAVSRSRGPYAYATVANPRHTRGKGSCIPRFAREGTAKLAHIINAASHKSFARFPACEFRNRAEINDGEPQGAVWWSYLGPLIERYDAVVLSLPAYAQRLTTPQRFIMPTINPFSTTNKEPYGNGDRRAPRPLLNQQRHTTIGVLGGVHHEYVRT